MALHSQYSPSSWPRARRCPASVKASEGYPNISSIDADHGSAAHHVGECALKSRRLVEDFAGCLVGVPPNDSEEEIYFVHEKNPLRSDWRGFEVDDEMVAAVQSYVDWCVDLGGDQFVEIRVDVSDVCPVPEQRGTSDHVACKPGVLIVTDLKYGKGVQVWAKENEQALGYAWGVYKEYDWLYNFHTIIIRICQPRLNHYDVWEITVEELHDYIDAIRKDLAVAEEPDPPFVPGEKQCKFCKHGANCKPLHKHWKDKKALAFDELEGQPDPNTLTTEEMIEAWHELPLVKIQISHIEKRLMEMAENNLPIPSLKVVESTTHRQWLSATKAEKILLEAGVPKEKLRPPSKFDLSPAQAEKLLPSKERVKLKPLYFKPPGQRVIVPETDPRPKFSDRHADAFEDESDGLD